MSSSPPPPPAPPPPPPPAPAPAPAQQSPPSVCNSDNSATLPTPQELPKVELDGGSQNGASHSVENKPALSHFQILDSVENLEKYRKYEADYTHRLMAKYFSKKNLYGGNIFDEKTTIEDETILSSRLPCTRSFADPVKGFEEQSSGGSTSTSET